MIFLLSALALGVVSAVQSVLTGHVVSHVTGVSTEMLEPGDLAMPVTPVFLSLAQYALHEIMTNPEDALAAFASADMNSEGAIHVQALPTAEQVMAGGCAGCTYLGLWADNEHSQQWGYPPSRHGHVWLFENGIRSFSESHHIPLADQVLETLTHEIAQHAVGRDHVLEDMRRAEAAGQWSHPASAGAEVIALQRQEQERSL